MRQKKKNKDWQELKIMIAKKKFIKVTIYVTIY